MMKYANKVIIVLILITNFVVSADEVKRKNNVYGTLHKVITPTSAVLKIKSDQGNDVLLYINLKALEVSKGQMVDCDLSPTNPNCQRTERLLKNKRLGVVIEKIEGLGVVGDLMVSGKSYIMDMLTTGTYKLDHTYTRRPSYLYAEAKAYCAMTGLWITNRNDPYVVKKCMSM